MQGLSTCCEVNRFEKLNDVATVAFASPPIIAPKPDEGTGQDTSFVRCTESSSLTSSGNTEDRIMDLDIFAAGSSIYLAG
jgi:hypothetical protein